MSRMRTVLLTATFLSGLGASAIAAPNDVTLKQVVLSSSGLGQYTFQAQVDSDTVLQLPVRREQVNDVLKSLVVLDSKGKIGAVTLPGDQGLSTLFRSLPFQQNAFGSLNEFILATRGQSVSIEGPVKATGQIMTLTPVVTKSSDGKETTQHILTLLTEDGLKQAVLEQVSTLKYLDEKLNVALKRAMQGFAAQTNNEQRQISIALTGDADREVGVSYTIESPVWKVAYRLRLPPATPKKDTDKEGYLQGWAIVENSSAEDWKDVQLTLTSGSPVTYQQALYPSYFVQRPILPLPIPNTVQPRIDSGVMNDVLNEAPMAAPVPMMMAKREMQRAESSASFTSSGVASDMASNTMFAGGQNTPVVQSQTTQLSFTFPTPVSVASGSSLMVPFWAEKIPGDIVYLYQPDTNAEHPYASVAIKNTGENSLPPGIVTLYQASGSDQPTQFVGDANMPLVPAGEERMIPYALDQETKIDQDADSRENITQITAAKGVLTLNFVQEQHNTYHIKAPAKKDRVIVIEEPKIGGWDLMTPDPKTVAETSTHYRIRRQVTAGQKTDLETVLQHIERQEIVITDLSQDALIGYIRMGGKISDEAKKALQEAAEKRRMVDDIDRKIQTAENQKNNLFAEQERLRKNLKAVPENSDLAKRYLKTLDDQETQVQTLEKQISDLQQKRAAAWSEFADFVPSMTF